jgi:hypothetical protein
VAAVAGQAERGVALVVGTVGVRNRPPLGKWTTFAHLFYHDCPGVRLNAGFLVLNLRSLPLNQPISLLVLSVTDRLLSNRRNGCP